MKETLIISKDDLISVSLAAFKLLISKNQKSPCKGLPLMLQYYQRWDGPAFLSANFLLAQTA